VDRQAEEHNAEEVVLLLHRHDRPAGREGHDADEVQPVPVLGLISGDGGQAVRSR
jgi:hypothetical protein